MSEHCEIMLACMDIRPDFRSHALGPNQTVFLTGQQQHPSSLTIVPPSHR